MDITGIQYLKAKFGDKFKYTYHVYPSGKYADPQFGGELEEILDEFKALLALDIKSTVQTENPRSKEWVIIDKAKGVLVAHLDEKLSNIESVKNKKRHGKH